MSRTQSRTWRVKSAGWPLPEAVPNWFQRTAHRWLEVPVPVIAAIHGHCLGGGLQIAMAADVRFATADSKLSVLEVKWD